MKKILATLLIATAALAGTAQAHGWGRAGWFVAGAGVGYLAARPYYGPH